MKQKAQKEYDKKSKDKRYYFQLNYDKGGERNDSRTQKTGAGYRAQKLQTVFLTRVIVYLCRWDGDVFLADLLRPVVERCGAVCVCRRFLAFAAGGFAAVTVLDGFRIGALDEQGEGVDVGVFVEGCGKGGCNILCSERNGVSADCRKRCAAGHGGDGGNRALVPYDRLAGHGVRLFCL